MEGVCKDAVTERIIGCAIRVHQELGPGLLESIYEAALQIELSNSGFDVERQKRLPVIFSGKEIGVHRLDMLIDDSVVIEIKSVSRFEPVFQAQLLSYMKLGGYQTGLLINFNTRMLKQGIKRMTL